MPLAHLTIYGMFLLGHSIGFLFEPLACYWYVSIGWILYMFQRWLTYYCSYRCSCPSIQCSNSDPNYACSASELYLSSTRHSSSEGSDYASATIPGATWSCPNRIDHAELPGRVGYMSMGRHALYSLAMTNPYSICHTNPFAVQEPVKPTNLAINSTITSSVVAGLASNVAVFFVSLSMSYLASMPFQSNQ